MKMEHLCSVASLIASAVGLRHAYQLEESPVGEGTDCRHRMSGVHCLVEFLCAVEVLFIAYIAY